MESWKLGLKAVAIYRDNCKVAQPLSMAKKEGTKEETPTVAAHMAVNVEEAVAEAVAEAAHHDTTTVRGAVRKNLPRIRNSKIFKFTVGGVRGYAIVGEYDDGSPGELFISVARMGSTLRGVLDSFAISVSYGLQFGVPLKNYVLNFTNTSFAPAGMTDDPEIQTASSIIDYIFRRLGKTYLSFDDQLEVGLAHIDDMPEGQASLLDETAVEAEIAQAEQEIAEEPKIAEASTAPAPSISATASTSQPEKKVVRRDEAAPLCYNCGNQTMRAGTCYVCTACGSTTGCS
jgi:ribonucleoside-diphosphate reductase alpha chain